MNYAVRITDYCNLNCDYCYAKTDAPKRMSEHTLRRVMNSIVELAEVLSSFDDERYEESVGSIEIKTSENTISIPEMKTLNDAIEEASEDIEESWWDDDDQEKVDKLTALKK